MRKHSKDRVVVVTGASAGVGRAVVREFARRGAHVGLLARGRVGLEAARAEVEAAGGRALAIPTDVANADQVEAAADAVERELGPIDIWINNAMVTVFSPFKQMEPEEFHRITEVTYMGQVYGTMAALRRMLPRDRGAIVLVGSALAYRGIPLQSAYCGAKHAVQGFSEALRSELLHDGSRVWITMVQLPAMNTPQFSWVKSRLPRKARPVPPIYEPEVAARAVVWAAHHRRREIEVGIPTVIAIWGNKFAAGLGDRYLARTGYDSQQHDGPEDAGRPHNLWHPVDDERDFGAHGKFGKHARPTSSQLWANTHLGIVLAAGAGALGAAGLAALKRRNGKRSIGQTTRHLGLGRMRELLPWPR